MKRPFEPVGGSLFFFCVEAESTFKDLEKRPIYLSMTAFAAMSSEQMLGDYRIVTELGRGGMGVVYFAEHQRIGRRVAIKVLRPELCQSEDMISRFFQEARTVNDIRHPNIVEITDCARVGEHYYIVMELLEGETLEERLERKGRIEESKVLEIAQPLASALSAAHEHDIVHRDLKPENIYLTNHPDYPDFVKVLDFGIAKLLTSAESSATASGTVLGTPIYMSPEQCVGQKDLDGRSDIYSLGVVLYEMLAGRPPFDFDAVGRLIVAHVGEQPTPLQDFVPDVSDDLVKVVTRALAKAPDDRFPSMMAMRDAIAEVGKPSTSTKETRALTNASDEPSQPRDPQVVPASTEEATSAAPAAEPAAADKPEEEAPEIRAEPIVDKLSRILLQRIQTRKLQLPSMPEAAMTALELLQKGHCSFRQLGEAVGQDPLLSTQILKVANSPVYSGIRRIRSVEEAVGRIGMRELDVLLVQLSVHQLFQSRNKRIRCAFDDLWNHCLAVAILAQEIAKQLELDMEREAIYLAGLLHDVGKPVVGSFLLEAERTLGQRGWMGERTWRETVERCHREVGVALAMAWKLPRDIARVVHGCHRLDPSAGPTPANVVCVANAFAELASEHTGVDEREIAETIMEAGQNILGFDARVLEVLKQTIEERTAYTRTKGGTKAECAATVITVRG